MSPVFRRILTLVLGLASFGILLLNIASEKEDLSLLSIANFTIDKMSKPKLTFPNSSFAIVVVVKNRKNEKEYEFALNTVLCYARQYNYSFHYIDISNDSRLAVECPQKDIMFQRHCVTEVMMRNRSEKWTVFIDADIGVINPHHRLEEYLVDGSYVMFYNRFYNDEIASGSYIVENSERGRAFIRFWSDYHYRMPKVKQHGTDNGALHSAIVEYFHPELDERRIMCEKIWRKSKSFNDLFDYETCIRVIMKEVNVTSGYHIFPKATGWTRDGWLTKGKFCKRDFMFHGWKDWKVGKEWDFQFSPDGFREKCEGNKSIEQWQYLPDVETSVEEIDRLLAKKRVKADADHLKRINRLIEKKHFIRTNASYIL